MRDIVNEKFDDFEESKNSYFSVLLETIASNIENGTIKKISIDDGIKINEFLMRLSNNKTLLDYVIKYGIELDEELEYKLINNTNVLEYLFRNDLIGPGVVKRTYNENVFYLCKEYYKYEYVRYINPDILYSKDITGKYLIEDLFKMNYDYLTDIARNSFSYLTDLYKVAKKYNKLNYYDRAVEEYMFTKEADGVTKFEKELKEDRITGNFVDRVIKSHTEAIYICIKHHKLDLLKSANEDLLFAPLKNGYTLFELLIDNHLINENVVKKVSYRPNRELAIELLLKNKLYLYLIYFPKSVFIKNGDGIILDRILEKYDRNNPIFNSMYLYDLDQFTNDEIATLYYTFEKYNLVALLPKLDEKELLTERKGKRLIDVLIEQDKTNKKINNVISINTARSPIINVILKLNNYTVKGWNVPIEENAFANNQRDDYLELKLDKEVKDRISKIILLFNMDGKTDKDLINNYIASIVHSAHNNYYYLLDELDIIIDYKKRHPELSLVKVDSRSNYNGTKKEIKLGNNFISSLDHEMGHLLHDITANTTKPEEYEEVTQRIRNSNEYLERIKDFSKKYKVMLDEISNETIKVYDEIYDGFFIRENLEKIKDYVIVKRDELEEKLKSLGYDSQLIKSIVDNQYDIEVDEYVREHRRIRLSEMSDEIMRVKAPYLIAISDIIDAVYKGAMTSNMIKDVKLFFGHGYNYYNTDNHGFDEMIANYSVLLKCDNREYAISYLRYLVGDEFVNMLDKYYKEKILNVDYEQKLSI